MKIHHIITVLVLLQNFVVRAQEKQMTLPNEEKLKFIDYNTHQNGFFSILQRGKKKMKTKYTLINENLETMTYTSAEKLKEPQALMRTFHLSIANPNPFDRIYYSHTGKNVLHKQSNTYYLLNGTEIEFAKNDINNKIEENPNVLKFDNGTPRDFISKEFLTDDYFLSIGRQEGAKNFNTGYYAAMDIYMYRKDVNNLKEDYLKLELPKDCCFLPVLDPKLFYYNNRFFMLSYLLNDGQTNKKFKHYDPVPEDQGKTYRIVTYNYGAEIISDVTIEVKRPENSDAFGFTNLGEDSFHYLPKNSDGSSRFGPMVAPEAMAQITYYENEDCFYAHSLLKQNGKDDAFMLQKFDKNGKLLWHTFQELSGFKTNGFNMTYMQLIIDVTKNFVGISLYSYGSYDHNKFYVFSKSTGQLLNKKQYNRHELKKVFNFLKSNKEYYSAMLLKNEFSEHLAVDKNTVLTCLYDAEYKKFIKNLSATSEDMALYTYFVPSGVITVAKPEKKSELQFYKFSLEKDAD